MITHVTKKDASVEKPGNIEYWNCNRCKKNFADKKGTKEITKSTTIDKLAPSIFEGNNQSIRFNEKKHLTIRSNALYSDFIEVRVDGYTLDIYKYIVASGSTIVTLNDSYVSTLSVGTHTLDIVSTNGTATAHFTVYEEESNTSSNTSSTKVVTCEEAMNSKNWTWSESKKACVYRVANTSAK